MATTATATTTSARRASEPRRAIEAASSKDRQQTYPRIEQLAARDREGLQLAVASLRKNVSGRVFLGGHSYGGRQASMLLAANPTLADGLLLLSYPLHPPRKPEQLRTQYFSKLQRKALFVHGSRDGFGSLQELESALKLIPVDTRLLPVPGAGHDLGFGAKKNLPADLPQTIVAALKELFN